MEKEQEKLFDKINFPKVSLITGLGYSLEHIWALELYYYKTTDTNIPTTIVDRLERKGLLANGVITRTGINLYDSILASTVTTSIQEIKKKLTRTKADSNLQYLEWLQHYPATATWVGPTGHIWKNSRPLRHNSPIIEKKYLEVLAEGLYTHQQMMDALDYQVEELKKESIRVNDNKLAYMQGTEPYLNQRTYEAIIETMKMTEGKEKSMPTPTQLQTFLI